MDEMKVPFGPARRAELWGKNSDEKHRNGRRDAHGGERQGKRPTGGWQYFLKLLLRQDRLGIGQTL